MCAPKRNVIAERELHAALRARVEATKDDSRAQAAPALALIFQAGWMALAWQAESYLPGLTGRLRRQEAEAGRCEDRAARAGPTSLTERAAKPGRSWDRDEWRSGNWPAAVRSLVSTARAGPMDSRR